MLLLAEILLATLTFTLSSYDIVFAQTSRTDTGTMLKEFSSITGECAGELKTIYGEAKIFLYLTQEKENGGKIKGTYDVYGSAGTFTGRSVVGTFRDGQLLLSRPGSYVRIEARVDADKKMEGTFYSSSGRPQELRAMCADKK